LAGAQLGLALGARARRWLGPVQVEARTRFTRAGGTQVEVAPLGVATLHTHRGPLGVQVRAVGVDPARAEGLLRMPGGDEDARDVRAQLHGLLGDVGDEAKALGRDLAVRATAAALGGAGVLGALALRRPRDAGAAAAFGAATLAGAAVVAAASAKRDAWRDPQLSGLLAKAPLILGDLQTAPQRIDTYRDQLADLVRTGTGVYRKITLLPDAPPDDAIRLLHISDIHLSPLAYPLAQALAEEYRVDAVIDTGDVVDWGTPAEEALVNQIAALGVPYVYVKGNHDSAGIARAVAKQPNATVLDGRTQPVTVAGLAFVGMPDPRFTPDKTTGDDHAGHRVTAAAEVFAGALRAAATRADIALVHSPSGGRKLAGIVPLVLCGDTHIRAARRFGDTIVLTQGTSGGSGLRGVQAEPTTPVDLSVLYLDRTSKQLWGVDEITLGGLGSVELSVVRRPLAALLNESEQSKALLNESEQSNALPTGSEQ
jgi:hypothetical protein